MNTKASFITVVAAATLSLGGVAVAQSIANPPSSTAGHGCTATANAMRGGNMSASPSGTACGPEATANTAAVVAPAAPAALVAPAAPVAQSAATTSMDSTSGMGSSGASAGQAPMRVARADRN